jgi:AcrR family transcriptional regulator
VIADGDAVSNAGDSLGPLSGGRHGLSPEQVAESQRERLLAATVTVVAKRGFAETPITEIAKAASVSNRVFYENFDDKKQAFIAAFDAVADHLRELIAAAIAEAGEEWPARVIACLRTALEFFDSQPELARFCLIAPFTSTPEIAAHMHETIAGADAYLAEGRRLHAGDSELPESTEDSLIGGAAGQVSRSLLTRGGGPLIELLPDLIEFGLSPYLGLDEARRLAAAS